MTHDELLAKIQDSRNDYNYVTPHSALRAVVELHKPEGNSAQQCKHDKKIYPCPTIQEIEKVLV
jgi:hypothetical protein